ncbi:MAG: hypothetical protein K6E51_02515 [Treponema sp.]|nr:hypothetical protein [Treponema sp.]
MNKHKKSFFFGIFIAILANSVFAQSEKMAFSIYGSDFLVSIPLPEYWTVDMDAAYQNNLNGFFYIAEKGIDETPVYIFLSLFEKKEDKTFSDFIQYRTTSFENEQPNYSIRKVGSESFKCAVNSWNVEIYDLKVKSGHGHYQIVVYMECENKYYIEIYIDCYEDDYKDNDIYIQDFVECFHEIDYLNIQLQE